MRSRWFGLIVFAVAAALSIWAYPRLPEVVATHWNLRGEPDKHSSRLIAAAMLPLGILVLTAIFALWPRFDPRRANYEKFGDTYRLLTNSVLVIALVGHGALLAAGLGYAVQVGRLLPIGLGLMLVFLGNYLTRVEPNWILGIRTPWTLSSDTVWRKTHRTGGLVFVIAGLVIAVGAALVPKYAVQLLVIAIVSASLIPVVQSYILWRREANANR